MSETPPATTDPAAPPAGAAAPAPLEYATDTARQPTMADDARRTAGGLSIVLTILGLPPLLFGWRTLYRAAFGAAQTNPLVLLLGISAVVAGALLLVPAIWWWFRDD